MPELAYVNGDIMPVDQAVVPVRDRGFIFGDGVYDVARVYRGRAFRLEAHTGRLLRCAGQLGFAQPPGMAELGAIVEDLVDRSGLGEAMIYMQLTRGVAPRRAAYPEGVAPTLFVSVEQVRRGAEALRDSGARAILVPDIRWKRNDIKTVNLLPKVLMGERAHQAGVYEALYRDDAGHVWEGTSTNLFAVIGGALHTAAEGPHILSGTTRAHVLQLADDLGYDVEFSALTDDELVDADEAFLTGTLTEVQGLVDIDGHRIGAGGVGPITREFQRAYDELIRHRIA